MVVLRVEHIVLQDEHHVHDNADEAQRELDWVPRHRRPVVGGRGVQHLLADGQQASGDVQQHVPDGPADRGLALVVERDLREALDQRRHELDVAQQVEQVERVDHRVLSVAGDEHGEREEQRGHDGAARPEDGGLADLLAAARVDGALEERDGHEHGRVQREEDVVELHGVAVAAVAPHVLLLHALAVVEGDVEDRVAREAQHVEHRVVQREPHDAAPLAVEKHLRVEAHAPAEEVDPAHDAGHAVPGPRDVRVGVQPEPEPQPRQQDERGHDGRALVHGKRHEGEAHGGAGRRKVL
ncbi:unnamed protein product [Phytophthora fragariaefolia]|uniref:Unnamed protein product n=1 Tax=Phytophthora fragariaefolia TaxID=1490495 RepID=A0A9W6TYU7_9STRA|nr:unnamed protein product [Phytophthora fragariaefolia]